MSGGYRDLTIARREYGNCAYLHPAPGRRARYARTLGQGIGDLRLCPPGLGSRCLEVMTHRIVVLGGGTDGTLTANRLRRLYTEDEAEITVVDQDDDSRSLASPRGGRREVGV